MEATFVILSRPLFMKAKNSENIYVPVYGFVIDNDAPTYSSQNIDDYVGYLAAMHFWSNSPAGECPFNVEYYPSPYDIPVWVDKKGEKHFNKDAFMVEVSRHYKKEMGLTYDFIKTDIYDEIYACCVDEDGLIVRDSLYYELRDRIEEDKENICD